MKKNILILICLFFCRCFSQDNSIAWIADNGNGTYKNPIIHGDYSDPDVIRVGDDFYMISSSFNSVPGLPILHSKDLVNWSIIGHALSTQFPEGTFDKVQHGGGVWAPSIRFKNNTFYIYFPDPDQGIFLVKSKSINGPWTSPKLVEAGKGLIDPCPLWDSNGKTYLTHAYAGSRAGFKSILVMEEMNAFGDSIVGKEVMIYDGHSIDPTIEGPKIYKRNKYYYIFAPAGGVSTGWQLVLRSKNIYGPYERKIVLQSGNTSINGPHQGAWVNTQTGEDWFIHFQDKDAFGRVVHLQPMHWENDWPVIGIDSKGNRQGQPVLTYSKPNLGMTFKKESPATSDEFDSTKIGFQWQWQANPKAGWAFPTPFGFLRMFCLKTLDAPSNYWMLPNILTQKFPADSFTATVKILFNPANNNDRVGIMVFGMDYAFLSLVKKDSGIYVSYNVCKEANKNKLENERLVRVWNNRDICFKIGVNASGECSFSFADDRKPFFKLPESFTAKPGKWVGAKIGLFATSTTITNDAGFADIDWFKITK